MNLAELVSEHPGEEARVPFYARNGHRVEVTAVLERTAVVHDGDITAKRLVRLDALTVEDGVVEFVATEATRRMKSSLRGRALRLTRATAKQQAWNGTLPMAPGEGERKRERGDIRALADQTKPRTIQIRVRVPKNPSGKSPYHSWMRNLALAEKGLRHCPRCDTSKALAEFSANGYCHECDRAYAKVKHYKSRISKPCPTCKEIKPMAAFPQGRRGSFACFDCSGRREIVDGV